MIVLRKQVRKNRNRAVPGGVLTFVIVALFFCSQSRAVSDQPQLPKQYRGFLKTHCFDCHDSQTQEGQVDLEQLPLNIRTLQQAELWQKVLNALNSGEMPPVESEQPGDVEKADFLEALAEAMVAARRALSDSGDRITIRRLNRREYQNTLEHLTGTRVDVSTLPADGGPDTFDTVGAAQFISSDQFEQYLKLGRLAIDEAFARLESQQRKPRVFRVEPETTVNVKSLNNMKKLEATHERYLLWQAEVDKAAAEPENEPVLAELRERYRLKDVIGNLRLYQNADLLKGAPDAKKFGFKDSNDASFSYQGGYGRLHAYIKHYAELPHSDRGTYLKLTWGIQRIDVSPGVKKMPPGTYVMRVRAGVVEGAPAFRHFIQIGHPQRVNQAGVGFAGLPLSSHQVTGTVEQPEIIETRIEVGLNTQREFGIQERQPTNTKSLRDEYNRNKRVNGYGTPPAIWVDWIELEGPLQEDQHASVLQRLLASQSSKNLASPRERAREILTVFSKEAFRDAAPDAMFIEKLLSLFESRLSAGDQFDEAIRAPLSVILASPAFLYLSEPGSDSDRRQLTDRELAVRLAYFLWSAPPDPTLLTLAANNELRQPKILHEQVERLLADPRSKAFVSGFVHQWLEMERLDFFQFDPSLHREFDENTRAAAREEVYQSFAHLLHDSPEGGIRNLLKSDYVFINGLLATYYGIDNVSGDEFRKVTLPSDSIRGGLLGMAAVHAMGSDGISSSPVERGAWILRHLLNDPPPPAPPNVPQISRLEGQVLTTRERLAAHQEEAQCASCHRKIDPIGFGLENFDAAGKWRTTDAFKLTDRRGRRVGKGKTWTIDASGAFHQGPAFDDYQDLRNLIVDRYENFSEGFTEDLIEYALGRPFSLIDEDLSTEILEAARDEDFALKAFIHALVQSQPFKTK